MQTGDKATVELSVQGMDCADEAQQIENALHKLEGVIEIKTFVAI